jgi:hypothetical protein
VDRWRPSRRPFDAHSLAPLPPPHRLRQGQVLEREREVDLEDDEWSTDQRPM